MILRRQQQNLNQTSTQNGHPIWVSYGRLLCGCGRKLTELKRHRTVVANTALGSMCQCLPIPYKRTTNSCKICQIHSNHTWFDSETKISVHTGDCNGHIGVTARFTQVQNLYIIRLQYEPILSQICSMFLSFFIFMLFHFALAVLRSYIIALNDANPLRACSLFPSVKQCINTFIRSPTSWSIFCKRLYFYSIWD